MFMICASTVDAQKRFVNKNFELKKDNSDFKNPRLSFFIEGKEKIIITSREYEFFKKLDIENRTGKKLTDKQKENVSNGTKNAMRKLDVVKTWGTGSRNTRHYYNKETGEAHKWFPGDPDIDLNIYAWGRKPMSEEQKIRLHESQRNVIMLYNKKLLICTTANKNSIRFDNLPENWKAKRAQVSNDMKAKIIPLFKEVYKNLALKEIFADYIWIAKNNRRKNISFGALIASEDILFKHILVK